MTSKLVLGAFVAGSLVFSSTAAGASVPQVQQANPWAVLAAMSGGAPAAAMCGAAAAAAAAQTPGGCVLPVLDAPPPPPVPAAGPPPPPPLVPAAASGIGINPLLISLIAIAAVVGIYLAVHNNGHGNSPA